MINELIKAFFFIFIAEMGDKTQILAMAFATQYRVGKVLLGITIGSALNHGLAILLGAYMSEFIPLNTVQVFAGFLFVGFGLLALKSENEEDEETSKNGFGPIVTVAIAFFIGELGDKTQLTAMTLATDANYPLFILFGTVLGMTITSGLGIFVATKIGKKIPEFTMKLVSAAVFIFFGTLKLYQTLPSEYITSSTVIVYSIVLIVSVYLLLRPTLKIGNKTRSTALKEVAATLYIQTHEIKETIENICVGKNKCGMCKGKECLIGFTKKALQSATDQEKYYLSSKWDDFPKYYNDNIDEDKVIEALAMSIAHLSSYAKQKDNYVINKTRKALEVILFGRILSFDGDIDKYYDRLVKQDKRISIKIIEKIREINKNRN